MYPLGYCSVAYKGISKWGSYAERPDSLGTPPLDVAFAR